MKLMGSGIMDLQSLQTHHIGAVALLVFLIALICHEASALQTDAAAIQYSGNAEQISTQQPSDVGKSLPVIPKDFGGVKDPQPMPIANPVACYSGCVIGCNPHLDGQEHSCQQRCAFHCWKK
jgi:hypothetical protein